MRKLSENEIASLARQNKLKIISAQETRGPSGSDDLSRVASVVEKISNICRIQSDRTIQLSEETRKIIRLLEKEIESARDPVEVKLNSDQGSNVKKWTFEIERDASSHLIKRITAKPTTPSGR